MEKKEISKNVALEVLSKTLWEICKTTTKTGIIAGAVSATGAGLPVIAVTALASYIGLIGYRELKKSKGDQELEKTLRKILTASITNEKNLQESLPEYYEFFDTKMDIEQILHRIQLLQKVTASSKGGIDYIIEQLQIQNELLEDFSGYINITFERYKEDIKKIITQELFEQFKALLDKRPCLRSNIYDMEDRDRFYPFFRYQYRWVDCVGRDEYFDRLGKFLEHEDKLLWWAITGNGGVGKSRLALELCLKQTGRNWYAGFLDNNQNFDHWNNWEPEVPTLIVVDYTDKRVEELGCRINSLYESSKGWTYPVRILLLDRDGSDRQGNWRDKFFKAGDTVVAHHTNYIEPGGVSETLVLEGLEDKWLIEIIEQIFKKHNVTLTKKKKKEILEAIPKIDEKRRPLYTAFIADACARGETVRGWDKGHLHGDILGHYKKIWRESLDYENDEIGRKHYNLLIFATMSNGISTQEGQTIESFANEIAETVGNNILPEVQNSEYEFDAVKYRLLSDNPDTSRLHSLEPDILGEYLVLDEWQIAKRKQVMEHLWQKAWSLYPYGVFWFLTLMFVDFKDKIDYEKIKPKDISNESCRKAWSQALFNIICIYGNEGCLEKAAEYYDRLERLWQDYKDDKDISLELAKAAVGCLIWNEKNNVSDGSDIYIKKFEELKNKFHGDKVISQLAELLAKYYENKKNDKKD